MFFRQWMCVGRVEEIPEAGDHLVCDVAGESVIVTRTRDGGPVRLLQPLPSPRLGARCRRGQATPERRSGRPAPSRVRSNAPITPGPTPSTGGSGPLPISTRATACGRRTFPSIQSPSRPGEVSSGSTSSRPKQRPLAGQLAGADDLSGQLSIDRPASPPSGSSTRSRPIGRRSSRTTTSATTAARSTPNSASWSPPSRQGGGADLDWENGIEHREGAWTFTATGTTNRQPFPGLSPEEKERHKGQLIYPNLMLSLSADHVAAFTLWPHAPDSTTVVCDFLFHRDEIARPGFDPSDAVEFWDMVNRQDWQVCQLVQRGMTSRRFTTGFYAPMED